MKMRRRVLGGVLLLGLFLVCAGARGAQPPRAYALIVIGIAGDEPHYQKFWDLGASLYRGLHERCGYSDEEIIFLFQDNPKGHAIVDGRSTKKGIEKAVDDLAAGLKPQDKLFIFVAGHANRSEGVVKIHLPGPDLTHGQFAKLLDKLPAAGQTVVVTTPLSGYLIREISRPGRICITATDAQPELSETVFAYQFVRGFFDAKADANRDGLLSVLELFRYATAGVKKFYHQKNLIPTEHALLDDDGDGVGRRDPQEKEREGKRAAEEYFEVGAGA